MPGAAQLRHFCRQSAHDHDTVDGTLYDRTLPIPYPRIRLELEYQADRLHQPVKATQLISAPAQRFFCLATACWSVLTSAVFASEQKCYVHLEDRRVLQHAPNSELDRYIPCNALTSFRHCATHCSTYSRSTRPHLLLRSTFAAQSLAETVSEKRCVACISPLACTDRKERPSRKPYLIAKAQP
jgi:hypothetical protein